MAGRTPNTLKTTGSRVRQTPRALASNRQKPFVASRQKALPDEDNSVRIARYASNVNAKSSSTGKVPGYGGQHKLTKVQSVKGKRKGFPRIYQ